MADYISHYEKNRLTVAFFAGMIFFAAISFALFYSSNFPGSVWKTDVAECAVVENPELRVTSGVAKYRVYFEDGKHVSIECINGDEEPPVIDY